MVNQYIVMEPQQKVMFYCSISKLIKILLISLLSVTKKKYNLYTPGTKIKIISEKLSRSLKPDYYFVLPWHFKKEILLREKKMRKNNTKFIFPLPKFTII